MFVPAGNSLYVKYLHIFFRNLIEGFSETKELLNKLMFSGVTCFFRISLSCLFGIWMHSKGVPIATTQLGLYTRSLISEKSPKDYVSFTISWPVVLLNSLFKIEDSSRSIKWSNISLRDFFYMTHDRIQKLMLDLAVKLGLERNSSFRSFSLFRAFSDLVKSA